MTNPCPPALRIDTDGTVTVLPNWTYETLRSGVGGLIEVAPTEDSITIWVNDEGKINRLPFNPVGHALWTLVDSYGCIPAGDWMAGPCVVTGPADYEGENTAVPEWVLPKLAELGGKLPSHRPGTSTIERVLEVLDVGLQNAECAPPDQRDPGPGWCVRCESRLPIETSGDLCPACRRFLTIASDTAGGELRCAEAD